MNENKYNILLKYAKSIDQNNAHDLVHDTYIKLIEGNKNFDEIEIGYMILTLKSIFLDKIRKSKRIGEVLFNDFDNFHIESVPEQEHDNIRLDLTVLSTFEKLLIDNLFGVEIFNKKEGIMELIDGCNMLQLSKESKIPYITIRTSLKNIKEKLKDQINDYEN